jgi:hypothetical protein
MPIPGLSLVGFMDQGQAVAYLRDSCVLEQTRQRDLLLRWHSAQTRRGDPFPRAGDPDILDIPNSHDAYLEAVKKNPRYARTVGTMNPSFKLVEIVPLLAFQFHVCLSRADGLWTAGGRPPEDEIVNRCLPHIPQKPTAIHYEEIPESKTFRIVSDDLNVQVINWGQFLNPQQQPIYDEGLHAFITGLTYGEGSSLVQVARFNGRCYLRNGYHRAYALGKLGVTHIPCILLDAPNFSDITERRGGFFSRGLLESNNPPTCGHFINDRAYSVTLKTRKRIIEFQCREGTPVVE